MNENPSAAEWSASRGEKWRVHAAGMEAMLAPVDEPLIEALRLTAPCRIADIGCGGGATTREILRRAPAGSIVHGFDIAPTLVELARSRKRSDESGIAFEVANMATTNLPGAPYDRLASRFGIMFFDDPTGAFANLRRWLTPGGRFAFTAWGALAENPWMAITRQVVAEIVDLPRPNSEAPGPFRYAEAENLLTLLGQAGFRELVVSDWRGLLPIGGGLPARDAAGFALTSFASLGDALAEAGDTALSEARQSLTERFSRCEQDGIVRTQACVHIFTGL